MLDSKRRGRRATALALTAIIAGATLVPGAAAGPVTAFNAVAKAKELARTLQTVEETYFTDHMTYTGSRSALVHIEPALAPYRSRFSVSATSTSYTIRVRASTGTVFRLIRFSSGDTRRSCSPRAAVGCTGGRW